MFIQEIASYLKSSGTFAGTDIYCGFMPDDKQSCIALYDKPGSAFPHPEACDDELLSLEIDVRHPTYEAASSCAYAVYFSLDRLYDAELGGHAYTYITAIRPPYHLGRDAALRHWFRVAFLVYRAPDKQSE